MSGAAKDFGRSWDMIATFGEAAVLRGAGCEGAKAGFGPPCALTCPGEPRRRPLSPAPDRDLPPAIADRGRSRGLGSRFRRTGREDALSARVRGRVGLGHTAGGPGRRSNLGG